MDVAATPTIRDAEGRDAEVRSAQQMIERVERTFGMKPKRLIGDTAYGTAEMLAWMVDEKKIAPHAPVWDKGERKDAIFSRSDFLFDPGANTYVCPGGKTLKHYRRHYEAARSGVDKDGHRRYRAGQADCAAASSKSDAARVSRGAR